MSVQRTQKYAGRILNSSGVVITIDVTDVDGIDCSADAIIGIDVRVVSYVNDAGGYGVYSEYYHFACSVLNGAIDQSPAAEYAGGNVLNVDFAAGAFTVSVSRSGDHYAVVECMYFKPGATDPAEA